MVAPDNVLVITRSVRIPFGELVYRASRSGGPGGQHVNRSATRVELRWNARTSPSLTDRQRERVLARLASRLDSTGTLRLTASSSRSQKQNRERVTARFQKLLADALRPPKRRKKTIVPAHVRRARREEKRRRAKRKAERRMSYDEE